MATAAARGLLERMDLLMRLNVAIISDKYVEDGDILRLVDVSSMEVSGTEPSPSPAGRLSGTEPPYLFIVWQCSIRGRHGAGVAARLPVASWQSY